MTRRPRPNLLGRECLPRRWLPVCMVSRWGSRRAECQSRSGTSTPVRSTMRGPPRRVPGRSCAVRLPRPRAGRACPGDADHRRSSQVDERGHVWHHWLVAGRRARADDPGGLGRGAEPQDEPVVVDDAALPEAGTACLDELEDKTEVRAARRAADASLLRGPRSSGSRQPRGCLRAASTCAGATTARGADRSTTARGGSPATSGRRAA